MVLSWGFFTACSLQTASCESKVQLIILASIRATQTHAATSTHCYCKNIDYGRFKLDRPVTKQEVRLGGLTGEEVSSFVTLCALTRLRSERSAGNGQVTRHLRRAGSSGHLRKVKGCIMTAVVGQNPGLHRENDLCVTSSLAGQTPCGALIRTSVLVWQYVRLIYDEGSCNHSS